MAKKKGRGKVRHYSEKEIAEAIVKSRGLVGPAAKLLGCSRVTIYDRVDASQYLKSVLEQTRENEKDNAESKLMDNIDGKDQRAIEFYLDRMARDRGYGRFSSVELEGRLLAGATVDLSKLSEAQLKALAKVRQREEGS